MLWESLWVRDEKRCISTLFFVSVLLTYKSVYTEKQTDSWFRLSRVWSTLTIRISDETTWTLLWKAEQCLAAEKPRINNSGWSQSHQVSRSFGLLSTEMRLRFGLKEGEKLTQREASGVLVVKFRVSLMLSGWQQDQYQSDVDVNTSAQWVWHWKSQIVRYEMSQSNDL